MDILERWQRTFDHEEPDRVSSFVQAIMTKKKAELDDLYGESFTADELCITPMGDFTLQRWCGFESTWGASAPRRVINPAWKPARYLVEKHGSWVHVEKPPTDGTRYRVEAFDGRISEVMGDGRDINFYVDGNLYVGPGGVVDQKDWDARETIRLWNDRFGQTTVELAEDAVYDRIAKDLDQTMSDFQFMPVFSLPGFAESVRESLGIRAFSRFLRTNPEVIANAARLHEPSLVSAAMAAAKVPAPFCIVADDVAYKHGVFCSPKHYAEFFAPLYKKVAAIVHKGGGKIFFHSDGYTEPYWDTWINECKFDGQESLEPQAWLLPEGEGSGPRANLEKPGRVIRHLKARYGDKFVLLGNMDMSTVMPMATPEEVAWVTRDIIESGAPGGGFIFACCTDITDATPLENVVAMRRAFYKHRSCYDR